MSNERPDVSRRPPAGGGSGLRPGRSLDTAGYRPVRTPLISMGPSLEDERRRHRMARTIAVSSVFVVTALVLLVWFVGLLGKEVVNGSAAGAAAPIGNRTAAAIERTGAPTPQTLAATVGEKGSSTLRLQLPIRREAITGIGFGPRHESGALELAPVGERANTSWARRAVRRFLATGPVSDLRWYQLADGALSMVVVGAAPGTEIYAPIDGTVEAITPYRIDGSNRGQLVQLQPSGDGQTIVVLRNLTADPDLRVGTTVSRSATRIGVVRDMEGSIKTRLAAYTHDSGSGVDMYVLRVLLPNSFVR
ncbi:MAG: hypothetical protein ABI200_01795 [Gaiellales bacterium]